MTSPTVIGVLVGYLLVLLGIGFWASRESGDLKGYFVAGKQFAKVPEVLLSWREHPDRLTHTDSRYSVENFLRAKAHYLLQGPLRDSDEIIVWGAGKTGRRLSKIGWYDSRTVLHLVFPSLVSW